MTLFVLYILRMNTLIVAALEAKSVGDNGEMEDRDPTPNIYYSLWKALVSRTGCIVLFQVLAVKANADLYIMPSSSFMHLKSKRARRQKLDLVRWSISPLRRFRQIRDHLFYNMIHTQYAPCLFFKMSKRYPIFLSEAASVFCLLTGGIIKSLSYNIFLYIHLLLPFSPHKERFCVDTHLFLCRNYPQFRHQSASSNRV